MQTQEMGGEEDACVGVEEDNFQQHQEGCSCSSHLY